MLVLTRRLGEEIVLPNLGVTISLTKVRGQSVSLGVSAPDSIRIMRSELLAQGDADWGHADRDRSDRAVLADAEERNDQTNRVAGDPTDAGST